MKKSLFAGATALALIAGAAIAQQSYDSTTTRSTTVTAPTVVVPVAPPAQTTTTVQQTVSPRVFDPTSSTREEHVTTQDGQVVEHTTRSETASPQGHTTTYTQTKTSSGDE